MAANAVELTVEQAWFIAEEVGCGSFPWVLAITPPYSEPAAAGQFAADRVAELTELGVMSGSGAVRITISVGANVISSNFASGGTMRSVPIASP